MLKDTAEARRRYNDLNRARALREGKPVPPEFPIEPERSPGPAAAMAAERERREHGR